MGKRADRPKEGYSYLPHQGKKERERRLRQIAKGQLKMAGTEEVKQKMLIDLWRANDEDE